jgi:hypothetical protein
VNSAFSDWAIRDWDKSGITPEAAAEAGMFIVRADQAPSILGFSLPDMPESYAITFHDPVTGEAMRTPDGRPFRSEFWCRFTRFKSG